MSLAEPVGQPFKELHSVSREGPAAAWMAPSFGRGKHVNSCLDIVWGLGGTGRVGGTGMAYHAAASQEGSVCCVDNGGRGEVCDGSADKGDL